MPFSLPEKLSVVARVIDELQPASVLDLGVGFGMHGAICRQYLDAAYGRLKPEDWKAKVVGVEVWEPYRNPAWALYDDVRIEDFSEDVRWEQYQGYNLVLLCDSLEHLRKGTALELLQSLRATNDAVLVAMPNGFRPQGKVFGNGHETHRSYWRAQDFREDPAARILMDEPAGLVTVFGSGMLAS